jgi:organic radical activating enzyme
MLTLPELTFYISHTCDLSCSNCFTYNNLNWGGHFEPPSNIDEFINLSKKVNFEEIFILGGEPTLNPHLFNWMKFVEEVWPDKKKWIVTNGRNFERLQNLYPDWYLTWQTEISAHSMEDLKNAFNWLETNLPSFSYEKFFCDMHEDGEWHYRLYSKGNEVGEMTESWLFYKTSTVAIEGKPLSWVSLNDANEQHNLCVAKECMYYVDNRFYRCYQQALLPHITKKFKVESKFLDIAKQDLGCTIDNFDSWVSSRLDPQEQCRLCDWKCKTTLPEYSNIKKIKVIQL